MLYIIMHNITGVDVKNMLSGKISKTTLRLI